MTRAQRKATSRETLPAPEGEVRVDAAGSGLTTSSIPMRLGPRIRHARLAREMSLNDLAKEVHCSASTLSKIEGEKANPSVAMLHRICTGLGSNLSELFSDKGDLGVVTRAGKRAVITTDQLRKGTGILLERLVPYSREHMLQGNVHVIQPGGGSDLELQHKGEELGYVIEGDLELIVDSKRYRLGAGDSFFFQSSLPHSYRNPGAKVTRVVWVNTRLWRTFAEALAIGPRSISPAANLALRAHTFAVSRASGA